MEFSYLFFQHQYDFCANHWFFVYHYLEIHPNYQLWNFLFLQDFQELFLKLDHEHLCAPTACLSISQHDDQKRKMPLGMSSNINSYQCFLRRVWQLFYQGFNKNIANMLSFMCGMMKNETVPISFWDIGLIIPRKNSILHIFCHKIILRWISEKNIRKFKFLTSWQITMSNWISISFSVVWSECYFIC